MKNKLFIRLFISLFSISAISLALLMAVSMETVRSHYIETVEDGLEKSAEILLLQIQNEFDNNNFAYVESSAKRISEKTGYRITIIKPDGQVLIDSDQDPSIMVNHADREEVSAAISGERGKARRFSTTRDTEMTYIALPIMKGDKVAGVLRLSVYLKNINTPIARFYYRFLLIALFIFAGMTVIAYFLSKRVYGPVEKLVKASKRISEGDFDAKVSLYKNDELKILADNFNNMSQSIKSLFMEIKENRDKLEGIIRTMEEGLLVIDSEGKIILANKGAEDILNAENTTGRYYREIIRIPEFSSVLSAASDGKRHRADISFQGHELEVHSSRLSAKGDTVVTLFDITELKKVDKVRKEFILNASHELRTPLTAIKGFLETMEDSINEENKKFLEIIERHTDRLINIVEDLIALSSAESGESLEMEMTDINEIVEQAILIVKTKAEKKGLSIKIDTDNPPQAMMDPYRMEQVLINLLDNAVKYTDSGSVNIAVSHDDSWIRTDVADTGIGIPEEHKSRIFERFYVADKSRTKKSGGTGLGLSIVKHIVLMHGGDVSFQSSEKGTVFTFRIPLKS